ncbi:GNAT family N-acetyltransferase [Pectobacterium parmentieri]|uniref:GNAT family N-acetyltransferase n=1 Tax=Pectobacterium parmentieri TaxID=1905730 RepID=A0A0H3I283_PECPM|nr:GNAT family N-acetyltransferase [Pectobacterium parmentieri]AFI89499.1 Ribosomal-protein-serine acetyltransferase [Pectobacterium parmentieri]AYH05229.1 GNAT family N-acetyltransferase [Pectobacterium parmentieri]AYH14051.1 GNAT family N-acetyltransferase [Pectobacterium parmentieri]AYH22755.1 GNAT family N-acetyltransferase [Pectobacterium parmentieri]MBI0469390.1 GNAT family N-acetyltransferase [Pectobacterium parmentieri]
METLFADKLYELRHQPHLRLTVQEESDADALFTLIQQEKPRLRRTLPWPDSVKSVDDTRETIRGNRQEFFSKTAAVYVIRWDDALAGIVSFNTIQDKEGVIGYWIAEEFEGKGIVSQAVSTLIAAYTDAKLVEHCVIKASTVNTRSNAVAQRLGFRFHHTAKNAEQIGEQWFDHNIYHYSA